jgi:UDP-glucose 4-epimerase
VSRRLASTAAAAKHLGFKAEIGLDEGLRDLVEWWRAEARSGGASAPPDRATRTPAERRG